MKQNGINISEKEEEKKENSSGCATLEVSRVRSGKNANIKRYHALCFLSLLRSCFTVIGLLIRAQLRVFDLRNVSLKARARG